MYREGYFQRWRPNLLCECGHGYQATHPFGNACNAPRCGCSRFHRAKKKPTTVDERGLCKIHSHGQSKRESTICANLQYQECLGHILSFLPHQRIELKIDGFPVGEAYIIDFIVYHADGTTEYLECKGIKFEKWKLKWAILQHMCRGNPMLKCRVVR